MIELSLQSARRILCVRLDSMGDVLMTSPAIRAIKESIPGCEITMLTSPAGVEISSLIPSIDRVIEYQAPWMKSSTKRKDSQEDLEMARLLKDMEFDAAVIFTVFSQNPLPAAFLCYLADIPFRLAHCRENPYDLLTHWVKDTESETGIRHEVRRQLDLVNTVGIGTINEGFDVFVSPESQITVFQKLKDLGVNPTVPWMVIHPGASAPSRRYPPEGFAEAAKLLIREDNLQIVFTGSAQESPLIGEIQANMDGLRSFSLAGQLSLDEMGSLLKAATLLLSNNTGPVHLAAGVGCPVVDLYALTNPQHTPWNVKNRVLFHDVPCKFCYKSICPQGHHHCLRLVNPMQVVEAVRELRQETPERWVLAASG